MSGRSWFAQPDKNTAYAAHTTPRLNGRQDRIAMHRLILDAPVDMQVDHINGNGLDNRRANLRLVTASQNSCNRRLSIVNTTGFKGVSFHKGRGLYQASIRLDGRLRFLGRFQTPEEAHKAYCEASEELHGAFGRTA